MSAEKLRAVKRPLVYERVHVVDAVLVLSFEVHAEAAQKFVISVLAEKRVYAVLCRYANPITVRPLGETGAVIIFY